MNAIALMGSLQSEPELRYTQDGMARLSMMLSFAPDRSEEADYQIRVVAFGNLAEEVHKTFHHGDGVVVEGRLQAETRTKPDGAKEKVTEVIARRVHSASGETRTATPATSVTAPAQPSASRPPRPAVAARPIAADLPDMDDIPF